MVYFAYDTNGFIWSTSLTEDMYLAPGYSKSSDDFEFEELINSSYNFPYYRYLNNTIYKITDVTEYQVDQDLWCKYQVYISDEIKTWFKFKTNDQMKAIYDVSPAWKQQLIYDNIHYFWGSMINQWNTNLSFETTIKLICEYMYIKEVEQRSLTSDELAVFNSWLTDMHNHNNMLFMPGQTKVFETPNWYQSFFDQLFPTVDYIRNLAIQQRIYVCGR